MLKKSTACLCTETKSDLESVIQSKVSQKEKNKYRILTHACGIQKNGTDGPICRSGIEMQMQETDMWQQGWWWCDELGDWD